MIFDTEFDGGLPVGTVIQAEGMGPPEPLWLALDGRQLSRTVAENELIEKLYPVGQLTGTIRTLPQVPSNSAPIIVAGDYYVTSGLSNSALAIQYSTDAATWSAATTPAISACAIVSTPTRLVALSSGANAPIFSASPIPSSAWSATASGPSSVAPGASLCRLCYVPTSVPGRVVAFHASTGVYTLDEGATVWVNRTSSARTGGAWSGGRVVGITATSAIASLSQDGATWADSPLPEAISSNQGNIASNGSGAMAITGCPSGLMISTDHGLTWRIWAIPGVPPSDTWRVQFSGGYFMIPTALGLAISPDVLHWFLEPTLVQALDPLTSVAKKGSTIAQVKGGSTTAYSLVESATNFLLPNRRLTSPANSGSPIPGNISYVKAL